MMAEVTFFPAKSRFCDNPPQLKYKHTFKSNIMRLHLFRYLSTVLLVCCLAWTNAAYAQSMPRTVVGSTGGFLDHVTFGDLHYTVGEIAVSRYIENGMQLDEGFHQAYFDIYVSAEEVPVMDWELKIFPNPVANRLYIQTPEEVPFKALLFNNLGQVVQMQEGMIQHGSLNVEDLPAGTYWLRLLDEQGRQGVYQIQKVRL
jgi:hypothetical protein